MPLAAIIIFISSFQILGVFSGSVPKPARYILKLTAPFHLVNRYGLFAVMTTSRPEIIVEGSNDGKTWTEYGFKYKPDAILERPRWVTPHQPRLDWQMWFAALRAERTMQNRDPSSYKYDPWLINFMLRLLQGSENVLSLLDENPYPQKPPRYVRALLYDYHFTDFDAKRANGAWWQRNIVGVYIPPISLKNID